MRLDFNDGDEKGLGWIIFLAKSDLNKFVGVLRIFWGYLVGLDE